MTSTAPIGPTCSTRELHARAALVSRGWPHLLAVAATQRGNYFGHVANLGVVPFVSASDAGNGWARLTPAEDYLTPDGFALPDGVVVRLEAISWIAEAEASPTDAQA